MFNKLKAIISEAIKRYDQFRSYRLLLSDLGLDHRLKEDADENQSYIAMAEIYYKQFLDKIKAKKYAKTQSGALEIELDNFTVYLHIGDDGSYNHSHYSDGYNTLDIHTDDLDKIENDRFTKSAFIHELAHHIEKLEDSESIHLDYTKYDEDEVKYYTQPSEIFANKIAICNFIIDQVKSNIQTTIQVKDLKDEQSLREYIKKLFEIIITSKGFLYYNFLQALSKDQKAFMEFYNEMLDTCVKYIQNDLKESNFVFAVCNSITEALKIPFDKDDDDLALYRRVFGKDPDD